MKFSVGDIVAISPVISNVSEEIGLELALVTETDRLTLTVVYLSEDLSAATELDPIVSPSIYGLETDVAVVTLAEAIIRFDQVSEVVTRVDAEICEEIIDCRYGNPSERYEHGLWLLPAPLDDRHDRLTRMIQGFIDWHSVDRDVIYCAPHEIQAAIAAVETTVPGRRDNNSQVVQHKRYLNWTHARDAAIKLAESDEERRLLVSENQRGMEMACLLIGR